MTGFNLTSDWAKLPLFDRSGWRTLSFGEFAQSINERVEPVEALEEIYVGLEHLDSQNLHIRRWGKGSDVVGTKLRFRKGDIIFGRRRAYQRKLAVAEFDGICSAHAMVVRAKPEMVLPEFLPFLMMSDKFMNRAVEISVGSLSPTINWTTLKLEKFDLPPLDQQRRIAEVLWAVDNVQVSVIKLQRDLLKSYEVFGNEQLINTKYPSAKLADLRKAGRLDIQTGPFGTVLQASSYIESGTPIINPVNMVNHRLITDNGPFLSEGECERLSRYKMERGDILLGRKGDVGRAVLVNENYAGFIVGSDLIRLRLKDALLEPEYLYYFMLTPKTRTWIARHASGTTMPGINEKLLCAIKIPIPPKLEQRKLVQAFEEMEAIEDDFHKHIYSISDLMVVLSNQLTGETK